MRYRVRSLFWIAELALAFYLVWSRVRILLFVRLSWFQLLVVPLVLAGIIYLLLDHFLGRLWRGDR